MFPSTRNALDGTLIFILSLLVQSGVAQEWTRFRGPNGTGISSATSIPTHWTEEAFNWKVELPGPGDSSAVVWANQIFVTSADAKSPKIYLSCINAGDGSTFWKKEFELVPYPLHQFNTFATSTPALDAKHVYLTWLTQGHYKLTALTHAGDKVWEQDLGAFESQHGSGGSPIVVGDNVILIKDPDGEGCIIAAAADDGHIRWRTALHGTRADYATPMIYEAERAKPVLVFNSMDDGVIAFEPDSGRVAWQLQKVFSQRCVASPILAGGLIIGSCGSGGGGNYVAAVRPGDGTSSNKPSLAYTIRKSAPYVPTSVAFGDLLFLWSDAGIVTCVHAPTGDVKWQERVGGDFFASPVCIQGKIFNISSTGEVVILEASDKFHELGRNRLEEGTRATAAVSGGRMYVRTFTHLISVGGQR